MLKLIMGLDGARDPILTGPRLQHIREAQMSVSEAVYNHNAWELLNSDAPLPFPTASHVHCLLF